MKKTFFITSLLATVLLYGCNGAFDPTEEPIIRGKGIEDRIYLTSEDGSHTECSCTVAIEAGRLILTLSEKATFTVNIRHQETETSIFDQEYTNTASASIDISSFPDGNYTLSVNEQDIFIFTVIGNMSYTEDGDSADIIDWVEIIPLAIPGSEEEFLKDFFVRDFYTSLPSFTIWNPRDTCYLINSRDEFHRLYAGAGELPEIDFASHTLLIGAVMKTAGFRLEEKTVGIADDAIVVTLTMKQLDGAFVCAFIPYYFWVLCEKLPQKDVVVEQKDIK